MNYSTAVFLINKHVRAVKATYEAGDSAGREIFKTLDTAVKVGDLVVVPTNTRHKMTVVKVVETDVDVDFDSAAPMLWIVSRIDTRNHEICLSQEGDAVAAIKSAELRKKREDLRDSLLKDHMSEIKALPIASMNGEAPAASAPETPDAARAS
jgi:hypothetical protein